MCVSEVEKCQVLRPQGSRLASELCRSAFGPEPAHRVSRASSATLQLSLEARTSRHLPKDD